MQFGSSLKDWSLYKLEGVWRRKRGGEGRGVLKQILEKKGGPEMFQGALGGLENYESSNCRFPCSDNVSDFDQFT